ncbi:Lrp/AsnC family transcriptional regulator [Microbulbifer sp. MLAF003]|uniref:Lrp/AsnC family transcriptional regulator n=1 Tax=Microbulbifer sp. MLAF003 TaxID=3032582 RepID=UPI0024AE484F|nr:Lrp/AsnC family transcriptional regulator [Microbulbifer sp. MLAF003]WHI53145.1 Lrp/AsnC family transcriptional regulator [Microbulbifer sp. MLAF003]
MSSLDAIDRQLLAILQSDVSLSIEELAERVGLTKTPAGAGCKSWRKAALSAAKLHC